MSVAGLVLAAGEGRRFGSAKALVPFGATTLVQRCCETLAAGGCGPVVSVVGAEAPRVIRSARVAARCVVVNPHWQRGLSSSLCAGLDLLAADDTVEAVVVGLVDQPLVSAAVIERLIAAWRQGAKAVVATYDETPRNPVLLDRSVWVEVAASSDGDQGARAWLRSHGDDVVGVPCGDVAGPDDIDTPDDLRRLVAQAFGPRREDTG